MTHVIAAHNGRDGNPAGFGILVLGILRAATFVGAFLLLLGAGRLSDWGLSKVALAAAVIFCLPAMEIACGAMQFLSIDYKMKAPYPIIFGILGTLFPLCVTAAGFTRHRALFLSGSSGAVVVGLLAIGFYGPLTADWYAERMK